MPAQSSDFIGIKVATIAPANPSLGKDRIQGVYLLMDAGSLGPITLIDGAALTTLRTSAISAAVADHLAPAEASHLVVIGSGPQAWDTSRPCELSGQGAGSRLSPGIRNGQAYSHPVYRPVGWMRAWALPKTCMTPR